MNTLILVALCAFVAYTSALPYPSEVAPESAPKSDVLVAVNTGSEGKSLVPAESAWGGYGWGHGGHHGYGGGWGYGYGGGQGWGYGGGSGHHGHHHGHHHGGYYGGHHGHHHWGR